MRDDVNCDEVMALAPELALGTAAGEKRARALQHLATCSECRRHLDELSGVADNLLLLAPAHQPPVGFESRVIDQISRERQPPRWRRVLPAVVAAVVAATAALTLLYVASGQDREFAAHYRRALEQAGGSYFGGVPIRDADGSRAGHVFAYAGSPSWVFVLLTGSTGSGTYAVELITREGTVVRLGSVTITNGRGTFGSTLSTSLRDVERIQLNDGGGEGLLTAEFPSP
jgi:Putative zinc-finger